MQGAALALRLTSRAANAALGLILPPRCLSCDEIVETQGALCACCFAATRFLAPPLCHSCGAPFADGHPAFLDRRVCAACDIDPPFWGRARAALSYDAQSRRIVLPFKYADRIELAAPLAALMFRAGAALLNDADVLVPVPMHRGRLFSRRYNQAALLARAVGRIARREVAVDALRRMRATSPLEHQTAEARAETVRGAFSVRPGREGKIAGRRALLIDDVLTSGATCGECARVLFEAGARSVDVLVAARVPTPGADGQGFSARLPSEDWT